MSRKTYYLPKPSGLEYVGREVFRHHNGVFYVSGDGYYFSDTLDVCPVYKRTIPKKGEVYLKPTGVKNRWKIMQANCDFQKHDYLICGSGQR